MPLQSLLFVLEQFDTKMVLLHQLLIKTGNDFPKKKHELKIEIWKVNRLEGPRLHPCIMFIRGGHAYFIISFCIEAILYKNGVTSLVTDNKRQRLLPKIRNINLSLESHPAQKTKMSFFYHFHQRWSCLFNQYGLFWSNLIIRLYHFI